jgi:hypothetical protein
MLIAVAGFLGFCLVLTGDLKRALEVGWHFCCI